MNQVGNWINQLKSYFKETQLELKKVVWPNRRYVATATLIILIIVLAVGVLVALIDLFFAKIFTYLMAVFS